jgi:hypothetical protein
MAVSVDRALDQGQLIEAAQQLIKCRTHIMGHHVLRSRRLGLIRPLRSVARNYLYSPESAAILAQYVDGLAIGKLQRIRERIAKSDMRAARKR